MSVINFPNKKLNKKKLIIFIVICIILFLILISSIIYCFSSSFRKLIDIYVFRKEISSDKLPQIEISSDEDHFFWAYDKYIAILNKKTLYIYNSAGINIAENNIDISSPIFANKNKFLAIGENGGNNLYLMSGTNIIWQTTLEGKISKISVNKNGYVSVIISGTSYNKSIVISFDASGNELFKTYISSNLAICAEISNDNKYLSIAEINYSGSMIKSTIKNISIEKTKTDPTNSVIYTYNFKENELLTNIKYHDKNNLICITNENIYSLNIADSTDNIITKIEKKYEFVDINLKNNLLYTYNNYSNFTNISYINILNSQTSSQSVYEFKGSIKSILCNEQKIAINTGTEIHFIGLNGWLIKKYDSYNEINNIILGNSIAGIIYKDKIKVVEI